MSKEKKVRWNSTFGEISVIEPIFNLPKKQEFRPFLLTSGITARCCSLPLQRVITDFGADDSFAKSAQKIKEHYAITIGESTIRKVTLLHAEAMDQQLARRGFLPRRNVSNSKYFNLYAKLKRYGRVYKTRPAKTDGSSRLLWFSATGFFTPSQCF